MKMLVCLLFSMSHLLAAPASSIQNPTEYLKKFDSKIYSLKTKGVKEFVVDIQSSQFTKQMNDSQTFGKISELIFRVYWTISPERYAIEIIGLPEGFKEVKDSLKSGIMEYLEQLIPVPTEKKFTGYKFYSSKQREIIAQDVSGLAGIPKYILTFDSLENLTETQGVLPVGTLVIKSVYEKPGYANGRIVLKENVIESNVTGQELRIRKTYNYEQHEGVGVLRQIHIVTEQNSVTNKGPANTTKDAFEFTNYKINTGEALKYFLGQ